MGRGLRVGTFEQSTPQAPITPHIIPRPSCVMQRPDFETPSRLRFASAFKKKQESANGGLSAARPQQERRLCGISARFRIGIVRAGGICVASKMRAVTSRVGGIPVRTTASPAISWSGFHSFFEHQLYNASAGWPILNIWPSWSSEVTECTELR